MYIKIILSIVIVALLNLVGCHSQKIITKNELVQVKEYSVLKVTTTNRNRYEFIKGKYTVTEDSIYGSGKLKLSKGKRISEDFEGTIQFKDISSIEANVFDTMNTVLGVVVGIGFVIMMISLSDLSKLSNSKR